MKIFFSNVFSLLNFISDFMRFPFFKGRKKEMGEKAENGNFLFFPFPRDDLVFV